jgi:hypothetical protein
MAEFPVEDDDSCNPSKVFLFLALVVKFVDDKNALRKLYCCMSQFVV